MEVKPIEIKSEARTEADFEKIHRSWAQRALIEPFRKRFRGEAWNPDALAFVEKAVDDLAYTLEWERTGALREEGKQLLADGCDDPLVVYLTNRIGSRVTADTGDSRKALGKLLVDLRKDGRFNRALVCLIAKDYHVVGKLNGKGRQRNGEEIVSLTREALEEGSYAEAGDEEVFLHHQVAAQWGGAAEKEPELFVGLSNGLKFPEWVQLTVKGSVEINLAWKDRGSGWAQTVTETGWRGFGEHLVQARDHLTNAWKLKPDRPYAATLMITVTMGGYGTTGETERDWFDRAIAAQFDYKSAYYRILHAYRPRWGGSHEQMLAFGKACLATKRYESPVPIFFYNACRNIAEELQDWRSFYRRPEVAKPLIALSRALVEEPSLATQRERRTHLLAVHLWMCGDYQAAAKILEGVPGKLHDGAQFALRGLRETENSMRSEVATLRSPPRKGE